MLHRPASHRSISGYPAILEGLISQESFHQEIHALNELIASNEPSSNDIVLMGAAQAIGGLVIIGGFISFAMSGMNSVENQGGMSSVMTPFIVFIVGMVIVMISSLARQRAIQASVMKQDEVLINTVGPHCDALTAKYRNEAVYFSLDVTKVTMSTYDSSRRSSFGNDSFDRPMGHRRGHRRLRTYRVNEYALKISVGTPVVGASPVVSPPAVAEPVVLATGDVEYSPIAIPSAPPAAAGDGGSASELEQLERLAAMKEKGMLTDKEFQELKSNIMKQHANRRGSSNV